MIKINKYFLILFAISLIIILCLVFKSEIYNRSNTLRYEARPMYLSDSNESTIIVTPILDTKIDKDKNLIYCSTIQMAWNELSNNQLKQTIEIENPPDYLKKLNTLLKQPPLISDDAYIVLGGIADQNTNKTIEIVVTNKFKKMLSADEMRFNFDISPGSLYAFSLLFKELLFTKEFEKVNKHLFKFNNNKVHVEAFGITDRRHESHDKYSKEIEVFHENNKITSYSTNELFVIKLKSISDSDEIIVSNIDPEETLQKTFIKIYDYINNPEKLHKFLSPSKLIIPKINFDITKNYDNITNRKIINDKYEGSKIYIFIQKIKFNINEKGVRLLSSSIEGVGANSNDLPRHFIINKPFFIYLKDKKANSPYFMAYICDDQLLIKDSDEEDKFEIIETLNKRFYFKKKQ